MRESENEFKSMNHESRLLELTPEASSNACAETGRELAERRRTNDSSMICVLRPAISMGARGAALMR